MDQVWQEDRGCRQQFDVPATVERRDFVHGLRSRDRRSDSVLFRISAEPVRSNDGHINRHEAGGLGTTVKQGDLLVEFDRQAQMKNFLISKPNIVTLRSRLRKAGGTGRSVGQR
jgi:hypothetical protein